MRRKWKNKNRKKQTIVKDPLAIMDTLLSVSVVIITISD